MKCAPLGNPLKSVQIQFKTASFGEKIISYETKNYPYNYNWRVICGEPTWLLSSIMYRAAEVSHFWLSISLPVK